MPTYVESHLAEHFAITNEKLIFYQIVFFECFYGWTVSKFWTFYIISSAINSILFY